MLKQHLVGHTLDETGTFRGKQAEPRRLPGHRVPALVCSLGSGRARAGQEEGVLLGIDSLALSAKACATDTLKANTFKGR